MSSLRCTMASFTALVVLMVVIVGFSFITKNIKKKPVHSEYFHLIQDARRRLDLANTLNQDLDVMARQEDDIDAERINMTVILEGIQYGGRETGGAPWMYNTGDNPFEITESNVSGIFAHTRLSWNLDGKGNGSCESKGSGKRSAGYLDPYNFYLGMREEPAFSEIKVELYNLTLSDFLHINTIDAGESWNITGAAGDSRRYINGVFRVFDSNQTLLHVQNVQWFQNVSYPQPIGESPAENPYISAYFIGEIDQVKSEDEWVLQVDPYGTGYALGILTAMSTGPDTCYSSASYWLSVRGFPRLEKRLTGLEADGEFGNAPGGGAKMGTYNGSTEASIARAITLSTLSNNVVTTSVAACVIGATGSAGASAIAPAASAASAGTPSYGAFRLITSAAFVAKTSEIYGFHSDSMKEFGNNLRFFIGKFDSPFSSNSGKEAQDSRHGDGKNYMLSYVHQEESDEEITVTDELFGGCAFYTTLIVVIFLTFHACIYLLTRKKPLTQQIAAHGWMLYLFSIVMSFVFTASVLNSVQYIRSHIGKGTGKPGLFFVAILQLLLVGIGFTAFFVTITVIALIRVKQKKLIWIPKNEIADPTIRQSTFIAGEYQAEDDNVFHKLFQSYYSSLAGPRLWLAGVELTVTFFDAVCTAAIWNEVACLAVLITLYALLFLLFLVFAPFVDRIEGRLVTTLGLIDLTLLIVEFIGALGDYETAERMENVGVIIGFVSLGFGVLIAVYCDLIPMMLIVWTGVKNKLYGLGDHTTLTGDTSSSDWSAISRIGAESNGSNERGLGDSLSWGDDDENQGNGIMKVIKNLFNRLHKGSGSGGGRNDNESGFFFYRRRHEEDEHNVPRVTETVQWPMMGQIVYTTSTTIEES